MATFGERLRELRERAGWTQATLAERCGLSLSSIRNYEQGHREPYWSQLFKLADALAVRVDVFRDCVSKDETASKVKGAKRPAGRSPKRKEK
jgi:transcriptional regulator with XRE-family HTH domain